ncbi:DUF6051 family protein [Faecalibacter rhinopitheci]|uniref:Alpha/beta hydrolase n=1 Tax=Faecalibacter rhinopitheci TaxID=2779678 RepID=A0A8J7K408_9FLAO|nr:DUF6051 family protein [Faecalibacter rhinopitheci]MBF0596839.1 hypothetical protein [Faecalibacter rhinopitheci]MBQ0148250.1 hypothetical protein [Candidatus Onthonaster equi]
MNYKELYEVLKNIFEHKEPFEIVNDLNLTIETVHFNSQRVDFLNGSPQYKCVKHDKNFIDNESFTHYNLPSVDVKDFEIECNKNFDYYVLKRADIDKVEGSIIFFHGLNEKKWDKYLPWAYELAQKTNKAIILFPIAFHMNRAEEIWSDRRQMAEVSNYRKTNFKDNTDCSFVNAAISSRLEAHPQRIFWSGFQTYSDIISVINDIRNNQIKSINSHSTIDLFGYSIGSFLSMILKMADPDEVFKNSKLFCFCGGMTIDRMFPISKYIMDARAAIKMQTVFAELLSSNFKSDPRLGHFQDQILHKQESWFKMMLRYNYFQKERELRIKDFEGQIKAYVLEKDEVAPPMEALNTLQGGYRNIKIDVQIEDFPFEYSHMVPFPLTNKIQDQVTKSFNDFIDSATRFYTA